MSVRVLFVGGPLDGQLREFKSFDSTVLSHPSGVQGSYVTFPNYWTDEGRLVDAAVWSDGTAASVQRVGFEGVVDPSSPSRDALSFTVARALDAVLAQGVHPVTVRLTMHPAGEVTAPRSWVRFRLSGLAPKSTVVSHDADASVSVPEPSGVSL